MKLGVVTGTDETYADLLPWWIKTFKKFNPDIPVSVALFGYIPKDILHFCQKEATVFSLIDYKTKLPWFKKPLAIYHSSYDKVIWFDNDCEIRGDIKPMYEYCGPNYIGATIDTCNQFCLTFDNHPIKNPLATGVIAATPKNELIHDWARLCIGAGAEFRGDQEVFNHIISSRQYHKYHKTVVNVMPAEYQWLRLAGNNDKAVVMHWTGEDGKSYIRNKLIPKCQ